jgi:hypothetical protein
MTDGLLATSLMQIGRGMALVGLLLGVTFYISTRYGRPVRARTERC